jgi:hypothetical protein
VADREIDLLAGEVDVVQRRRDPQVDVRMRLGEVPETVNEPLGGEIRRGADGEHARALALHDARGAERDPVEGVAQQGKIIAPGLGDDEPLALAVEQLEAERRLERLDLMAHRALRDAKLVCRPGEALMPRRGLEGLERIERRKTAKHRATA